jgi:PKD repeat protein
MYTVTLAVTGPGGNDIVNQTNYITVYAPVQAAFTAKPTSGPVPLDVAFINTSSGDYSTSLWDFGDGLTSTLESPTHTYTVVGVYTVTLTVKGLGGSDTLNYSHCITVHPPLYAAFTASPTLGFAPLTVTFTNTSGGDYNTSLWDFGDGVTSTLDSPTHTYTLPGTHTVTLTVSGPGGTDTATRAGYITVYETVKANFTASPDHGPAPLSVSFTDTSSGPVAAWHWDFGDGATSTLQNPTHIYTETGIYTVALTAQVTGSSALLPGGTDTLTRAHAITVTEAQPHADFIGAPRSGNAPLTVWFTSTVTGSITEYQWDFGDGGVADTANPTYTYRNAGDYGVVLTVIGPGEMVEVTKLSYINVNAPAGVPTATFSADVISGTAPLDVTFTAVTSGTVEHWLWSFGDGNTASTSSKVRHTYVTSGTFDVSLTVSNTFGNYIANKPNYITVRTEGEMEYPIYLPLVLRNNQ